MSDTDEKRVQQLLEVHKNTKDKRLAYKVNSLILLYKGYTYQQIEDALLLDERTIRRYRDRYESEGITGLLLDQYKGGSSSLSERQIQDLAYDLDSQLFPTAKSVCEHVSARFNISYTPGGMVKLLKRMGYSYKKTKIVPSKANRSEQETFVELYEELKENMKSDEKLYFMDGVHPTHNVSPGYCWIRTGKNREVKSNSGRERVNINGVYSPSDHEIIVRDDNSINSDSTIKLLEEIELRHPELQRIYVVRDNARYYVSKPVQEYLKKSRIVFVPLPSYSPNLNLIERLWKFFKKKVITNRYYETFGSFRNAILKFFELDIGMYTKELDSLMTEKFHIMDSA